MPLRFPHLTQRTWRRQTGGLSATATGFLAFMLAVLTVTLGCGDGRPPLAPVSGTILIDGAPLTKGFVRFIPEGSRASAGDLDEQGRFRLSCFDQDDGAIVGKHRVEVYGLEGIDDDHIRWHAPKKYCNWSTSGLEQEVKEQANDFVIELQWNGGSPFVE